MKSSQCSTVVGVFQDASHAQEAIRDLKQAGFQDDQIGVVAQDKGVAAEAKTGVKGQTTAAHVAEGAVAGVATGAGVGALWALGIAAGFMPVIGPVVAGGLLASVLASAVGGAAIAGIVGALVGLGIPEEDAHYYEDEFKAGRVIVTVKADDGRSEEIWSFLQRHGAYNRQTAAPVAAAAAARGDQTVEVHEEQLHATKKKVAAGEVRVRKEVVTEQQTIQVPVTREEVVIERHPASGRASHMKPGEEVRIPVMQEQVHLEKEAVVTEEISVGKRLVTDTQELSGTVRKEQVRVETEGGARAHGDVTDTKKRK